MGCNRPLLFTHPLEQENERDATDAEHSEKTEIKNEGEELRLLLQLQIEQVERLQCRLAAGLII